MGHFVLAAWPRGAEPSTVGDLRSAGAAAGWAPLLHTGGVFVAGGGPRPPTLQRVQDGSTVVVGDYFAAGAARAESPVASPVERCRRLTQAGWGRYVALILGPDGSLEALFRDPSGGWDCVVWREGDLVFAASSAPTWLRRARRLSWAVDWDRMADILADPLLVSADPPLRGAEALSPGEVRPILSKGPGTVVWTPARAARAMEADPERAASRLRTALDGAVGRLAASASGVLTEVSGGLDSAIVAASLVSGAAPPRMVFWNIRGPYAESDERRYVEAMARRLGSEVVVAERSEPRGEGELGLRHPPAFRPSVHWLDAVHDRAHAALCRDRGLDMILTGMGGDVALFQTATTAILADLIAARGPLALVDPLGLVLARRMRRSVWAVWGRALRVGGRRLRRRPTEFIAPEVRRRRPKPHPWLGDLEGLPLAKRIQIAGFAHNLSLHGLSGRSEAADLIHPYLTQPVMEACLATPVPVLTLGGHDRLLARRAFADRVPEEILARRSKGELGSYYGRCIAAAGERLRAHLLEGRLAGAGLLDRSGLEAALEPDQLMSSGRYADILTLTGLESWAQSWGGDPPPWER